MRPDNSKIIAAIVLHDVHKVYENAAGKFVALKGIDLQLDYGQFISIVGKSGCGKSTLLNMITGIDHPTSGEVIIGNEHIYEMNKSTACTVAWQKYGRCLPVFPAITNPDPAGKYDAAYGLHQDIPVQ